MKFFTNQDQANSLFEKFKGIFEANPDIERFDALIGYLRASGWFAIQPWLAKVGKVRILVGINVDSILAEHNKKGLLFAGDDEKVRAQVGRAMRGDIQEAPYERDIEDGVRQFVADVASGRVEIRAHPKRKLHAKVYVFLPKGFGEHKPGAVITGSSNLTAAGLGVEDAETNYEFNVLLHQYDEVKFAGDEFERLWAESVKILPEQIEEVKRETYIGVETTPRELYFKLLCEYFGSAIEYDPNAVSDLPSGYKRLHYQADAVSAGYRLLDKHGGFFLADVVGLGKTVIATLIAKKFFFKNGFPEHRSNTLIVVPPTVEENWRETTERFKLDNCTIVTLGKISSVRKPEKYDLVIVDEAHRFRNDATGQFEELQRLCKTPGERLDDEGARMAKKVILVSATPLNNRPADLRNLISLFQDLRRSTLAVLNLQAYFASKEKAYADARNLPIDDARIAVKEIYADIRTKVLSEIIIRRTRSDLLGHEEYRDDLESQGVRFPKVERPEPVLYKLSPALEDLYDRSMAALAGSGPLALRYARYRALEFLKPDVREGVPMAEMAAAQLAKIMRIGLAKRLDSSFTAFRLSLRRFRDATRVMAENLETGIVYVSSEINITKLILEGEEERLAEILAEGDEDKLKVFKADQFQDTFLPDLRADLEALENLCSAWDMVEEDPKFDEFLDHMNGRFFDHEVNVEGKLVVFSEAKDTTDYLHARLKAAGFSRVLCVDSTNRKELGESIKANFDANAKQKSNDYDVILTTQVLAEGVNLHRSNVIVNYDTPWNSTLLMQRIGRVNRIGTVADKVRIFNFYPSAQVDSDFDLRKRAIMKLQAFHSALGEDSQIYSDEEEVETFGLFDRNGYMTLLRRRRAQGGYGDCRRRARLLTLPRWSSSERAAPNVLLRGLFKALNAGDHGYVQAKKPEILLETPTLRIRYAGPVLAQAELDVWQALLDIASRTGSMTIQVSNAALLAALGRSDGGKQYQLLHEQVTKLVGAVPEVTAGGRIEMNNLVTASFDIDSKLWTIRLNPYIAELFRSHGYTRIDLAERRALAASPTAQWLHVFFATHTDAAPYPLTQLQRISGRPEANFVRDIKLALEVIERELPTTKNTNTADLPQNQRHGWCIELVNQGTARKPDYTLHMHRNGLTSVEVQAAKLERAQQKRARAAGKQAPAESPAPLYAVPAPVATWAELTKDGLAALAYLPVEKLEALATPAELRRAKALVEYQAPRGDADCADLVTHLIGVMRVSRDPDFDNEYWNVFDELTEI